MDADKINPFAPAGKVRCFITGKLRKDTPEENVRQRWARSLVEEYKYSKSDIVLEFSVKMGVSRKRADIVIFNHDASRKQENISIIVEAKREDVKPQDRKEGIDQLKSYMAACSTCRYGLWVGSERQGFEKSKNGAIQEGLADIPKKGDSEPKIPVYSELVPAQDLKTTFKRCHNYIYANQGLQKAEAFHEMLKLIFCKVHDETETSGDLQFYVSNEERRSEAGQIKLLEDRIQPLFRSVKERYPYIFKKEEDIGLHKRVLAYIVSEIQRISLLQTKTDIKGAAYEELVGANLRGDRGEYFTPRNVCDMTAEIVVSMFPVHRLSNVRILDTCCGTGGFLVSYLNVLRGIFSEQERNKTSDGGIDERVSSRIKDACSRNLFGTDINPFLVRTCQMNLVMHGDGSSNVFRADTLVFPAEWDSQDAIQSISHKKFDIVLTNPPFGSEAKIDDPHLLSRYELPTIQANTPRNSMPVEQLFVEGAWNFLKPGGYLGIVLPDSILNNPSLEFIRSWLLKRSRIIASIDMPKETFAVSKGVPNPSVLIIQRFTREEMKIAEAGELDNYHIFMAIPKTAGVDKRGAPLYLKSDDGSEVLDGEMNRIIDDEIALVSDSFIGWNFNG